VTGVGLLLILQATRSGEKEKEEEVYMDIGHGCTDTKHELSDSLFRV
jgi:hypothetical protein